ncbi:MAG: hypothetical protein KAS04_02685 [Candidatus Aenigmarchaeota archaeon]|nr:hypothetical protein [Candidatus Aenigmarchaeota archaeon]
MNYIFPTQPPIKEIYMGDWGLSIIKQKKRYFERLFSKNKYKYFCRVQEDICKFKKEKEKYQKNNSLVGTIAPLNGKGWQKVNELKRGFLNNLERRDYKEMNQLGIEIRMMSHIEDEIYNK